MPNSKLSSQLRLSSRSMHSSRLSSQLRLCNRPMPNSKHSNKRLYSKQLIRLPISLIILATMLHSRQHSKLQLRLCSN